MYWNDMDARLDERSARDIIGRAAGEGSFCKVPTGEEVAENEKVFRETGFKIPPCDDVLVKCVQEQGYIANCMDTNDLDGPSECLQDVANVHGAVSKELAAVARGQKSIYRSYDWWETYADPLPLSERAEKIADIRRQAGAGKVENPGYSKAGEEEFRAEITGGTSWGTDKAFFERMSWLYFEAKNPPIGAVNIPHTYFVNSVYGGEESGIEIKLKRGATVPVTLHFECKPGRKLDTGGWENNVVVDPRVIDKPVTFMSPGRRSRR